MSREKSRLRRALFAAAGSKLDLEGIGKSLETGVLNRNFQNLLNVWPSKKLSILCHSGSRIGNGEEWGGTDVQGSSYNNLDEKMKGQQRHNTCLTFLLGKWEPEALVGMGVPSGQPWLWDWAKLACSFGGRSQGSRVSSSMIQLQEARGSLVSQGREMERWSQSITNIIIKIITIIPSSPSPSSPPSPSLSPSIITVITITFHHHHHHHHFPSLPPSPSPPPSPSLSVITVTFHHHHHLHHHYYYHHHYHRHFPSSAPPAAASQVITSEHVLHAT